MLIMRRPSRLSVEMLGIQDFDMLRFGGYDETRRF